MIETIDLCLYFDRIKAVDSMSVKFPSQRITGLIGPNGAGKTTLFNCIAGMLTPNSGRVNFNGQDVTGKAPHELFQLGLSRTFQVTREFGSLSVLENLLVVPAKQVGENIWQTLSRPKLVSEQEEKARLKALEIIEFLDLTHLVHEKAGNLSGGQRKLVEIGRVMMSEPKFVLLDEMGAGINPSLLNRIGDTIKSLNRDYGYSFGLIEHNIDFVERMCDDVIVMSEGTLLTEAPAMEVRHRDEVISAYLGIDSDADADSNSRTDALSELPVAIDGASASRSNLPENS